MNHKLSNNYKELRSNIFYLSNKISIRISNILLKNKYHTKLQKKTEEKPKKNPTYIHEYIHITI